MVAGAWRRVVAGVCGVGLVVTGAVVAAPVQAAPGPEAREKIQQGLSAEFDEVGRTDFWVRLGERPDLSAFEGVRDWGARGQGVYDALTSTAEASQREVVAELEAAGATYRSFWITNAVHVTGGTESLALELAGQDEVEGIYPTISYETPEVEPVTSDLVGPAAVEWGVSDVNADDVWSEFGITGEGIVVATIDTGVQYDHPALVGAYRGNNGDGSFDHDYNWFDAAGFSPEEPADFDAHGSHVTGTMVGDDGGDNQIGVAPGARWIAANGCCPSDQALISSGEWMLAPTRIDGSDPDPAMRPHVINNSWGTGLPSNDPFMEDVSLAWAAAGQFGVWANGNIGPGCETSGSPGSRIVNYSVGNYDAAHEINPDSSRGAGQDGETKPNISAPGTAVRSSVPGNDYAYFSGTSMASPHVAGAIALVWASSPQLVGDIEGTRALLDGTATDNPDDQCGGTDEDNNVFGEGRLDALALVQAAPRGDVGYVEGTVTDAASGDPLAGASVELAGPLERVLSTGADGTYRALVSSGDYTVTASRFGWVSASAAVSVPVDDTVTQDFALDPAETGTVSGTVTDGSGHGFPLYAQVAVAGESLLTFTDPVDGSYSIDVPVGADVTMEVVVQYPGYLVVEEAVTVTGDAVVDVAVPVDAASCLAPGYEATADAVLAESFDGGVLPAGWEVDDNLDNGQVWTIDEGDADPPNLTGGEGPFAIVNSDSYGPEGEQDTSLVSPVLDLSAYADPSLSFNHFYLPLGESADLDVSVDGGASWTTVTTYTTPVEGAEAVVPLPMAAGESQVRVRWHYYDAFYAWFWEVDDVFVGSRSCVPVGDGGYVVGNVSATADGSAVTGATITSLDVPEDTGVSRATPADEGQEDGFYWLFSSVSGDHPFEASARGFAPAAQDVAVVGGGAVRADFVLDGGLLELDPQRIETEVTLGDDAETAELTVTNTGTGPAEVTLEEVRGGVELLRADGSRVTTLGEGQAAGAPTRTADVDPFVGAYLSPQRSEDGPADRRPHEEPWTELTPLPTPIVDNGVVNLDGTWYTFGGFDGNEPTPATHRYDPATMEWVQVADLPLPLMAPTVGALDGRIVAAGGWDSSGVAQTGTYAYAPEADEWTQLADAPVAVTWAGQATLGGLLYSVGGCTTDMCDPTSATTAAYDPATDSWTTLADYPQPIAYPSCAGIDGRVICAGGVGDGEVSTSATYAYDPDADSWTQVADAPVDAWGAAYAGANDQLVLTGGLQAGAVTNDAFAYDPAADTWSDLPNPNTPSFRGAGACGFALVGGQSDQGFSDVVELLPGYDLCDDAGADVPWLSLSQTELSLAAGESATVEVTTSGEVAQPGTYTAGIEAGGGMPGTAPTTEVEMTVLPPATWGKLTGLVTGADCEGAGSPLPGATVDAAPTRMEDPRWRWVTDVEGRYARWIDTRVGELELIASAGGYRPEQALVDPLRGQVVETDFALLDAGCEPDPGPIHPEVVRIAGEDRYGTAVELSQRYAPGVESVLLSTGADFPDALAGAALAGSVEVPVLLTEPDVLPAVTSAELQRLNPAEVVVLGGDGAVEDAVVEAAADAAQAPARRLAGTDRYGTAARVAAEFGSAGTAYVATGLNYPDALAGAARAGAVDAPVLLVRPGSVPAATAQALTDLGVEQIVLLGGTGAVEESVAIALGAYGEVTRVAGDDRFHTAALLAEDHPTAADVFVASGQNWPDALAGAAVAGAQDAPMLLVRQDSVPPVTWTALERLEPGVVHVLGGDAAIDDDVLDLLRTLE
ncbi:cell wall-binding repeat-containing protein [Serinicoccus kebangsaanensis]|uniref:cell wall-binding repeat-containing protein n=1 Tax=Serinicoccus kebangsaanensis TaxID=2602069 RepID=UPI00124D56F6|nr:cell wall-binding repeat-containing protein [Serinicoccus kebangsaanensis]